MDTIYQIKYIDPAGLPQDLAVKIPPQVIIVIRPEDEVEMNLEVRNIIAIKKAKIEVEPNNTK